MTDFDGLVCEKLVGLSGAINEFFKRHNIDVNSLPAGTVINVDDYEECVYDEGFEIPEYVRVESTDD